MTYELLAYYSFVFCTQLFIERRAIGMYGKRGSHLDLDDHFRLNFLDHGQWITYSLIVRSNSVLMTPSLIHKSRIKMLLNGLFT